MTSKNFEYEDLAKAFRIDLMNDLIQALKDAGIAEDEMEPLVGDWMANFCSKVDFGGGIEVDGVRFKPVISFASDNQVVEPYEAYQYHEHIWPDVGEYFDK